MPNIKNENLFIQAQSGHTFCNLSKSKDPHKINSIATNRSNNKNYFPIVRTPYHYNNSQTASLSFCSTTRCEYATLMIRLANVQNVRSLLVNVQQHQIVQTFLQRRRALITFEMSLRIEPSLRCSIHCRNDANELEKCDHLRH